MSKSSDGRYDHTKPWITKPEVSYPPQAYIGPFSSNQERLVSQAMAVGLMTAAEVQEYVRPPLPQVQLFPEKYGYHSDEIGINDVVILSGRVKEQRVESDYSQTPNTQQSTSRNTLGQSI